MLPSSKGTRPRKRSSMRTCIPSYSPSRSSTPARAAVHWSLNLAKTRTDIWLNNMPYKDYEKQKARARERYHQPEIKEKMATYRRGHRDIFAARNKTQYEAMSTEDRRARQIKFHRGHPGYKKAYHLWHRYGLTEEALESMIRGQGGTCAVCHTDKWGPNGPHVDHDHNTMEVRGILCAKCNQAAGMLGDDPGIALLLSRYLEKPKK